MDVSQWAEIRRLHVVEKLSQREIARRVRCHRNTVRRALAQAEPLTARSPSRGSILDPYKSKIDQLVKEFPQLSAVRIFEEIRQGDDGYRGSVILVRRYVRTIRPAKGRVYQEVQHDPGQAMQVDWGDCDTLRIENTTRKVSVFVAVLCYSRMIYIEFALSQRKAEFYRAIANALAFFGGVPRRIIFDNLKAAVVNGHGRNACLHPEFVALCGHYYLEPIACARNDPESKGMVEGGVRYVKRNALAGRAAQLTDWEAYRQLAITWRDTVANVRTHETTRERPIDRFERERAHLRPLPVRPYDTDEITEAIVNSHALVKFDANRYSVPADYFRKPVTLRASVDQLQILSQGRVIATHVRSYARWKKVIHPEHQLQALQLRRRTRAKDVESAFDALGPAACQFHLQLQRRPVKTTTHLRRLLKLVQLYGKPDVLQAIARAHELQTYDAAYVETILLQERRRQELPSPTPLRPKRKELIEEIECEAPDPADYDKLFGYFDEDTESTSNPDQGNPDQGNPDQGNPDQGNKDLESPQELSDDETE
jgi:transposase